MSVTRIIDGVVHEFASDEEAGQFVFQDMLRARRAPGFAGTTKSLMHGRGQNEDFAKLPKDMQQYYLKRAKEAGVDISGKVYHQGIAREAGDPGAWINDEHDLKHRAEARGLHVEGVVNYAPSSQARKRREQRVAVRHAREAAERAAERKRLTAAGKASKIIL